MATNLSANVLALATRVGEECKKLHGEIGTLGQLKTTSKTSAVAAINELYDSLSSVVDDLGDIIDDSAPADDKTYSSNKIASEILAACNKVKNDLLNGAGEAYDTLKELGDLIDQNKSAIEALQALAAGHVKYDAAQELTEPQKTTARSNIGAASASDLATLTTNVGDTTADFVAAFESALTD